MNDNDIITYCKPGLQKKRFQKLKNGALKIHFEIDLHGKTLAEANDFLDMHIPSLLEKNCNCGLIIHGKGYNSGPDGPKLKSFVQSYLIEHKNKLLSEKINFDYLDILIREKLKFGHSKEIIIKLNE